MCLYIRKSNPAYFSLPIISHPIYNDYSWFNFTRYFYRNLHRFLFTMAIKVRNGKSYFRGRALSCFNAMSLKYLSCSHSVTDLYLLLHCISYVYYLSWIAEQPIHIAIDSIDSSSCETFPLLLQIILLKI